MTNLKEVCACGCHKDTHFEKKWACLGARCECKQYRDTAAPVKPVRPDGHPTWCQCFGCKAAGWKPYGDPRDDVQTTIDTPLLPRPWWGPP